MREPTLAQVANCMVKLGLPKARARFKKEHPYLLGAARKVRNILDFFGVTGDVDSYSIAKLTTPKQYNVIKHSEYTDSEIVRRIIKE